MSGGSFDYMYLRIEDTYAGQTEDNMLDELIRDLCVVLHNLEWWKSGDIVEEDYRKTLAEFKGRWVKKDKC